MAPGNKTRGFFTLKLDIPCRVGNLSLVQKQQASEPAGRHSPGMTDRNNPFTSNLLTCRFSCV